MRAKTWAYVGVFAPLLLVSACLAVGCEMYQGMKGDPDDLPDTTVSQADAIHRVDELVREALDLLPSQARSASRDGLAKATVDDNCEIGMEKKRSGQIHVNAGYQVFDLPPERFAEYFERLAQFASGNGRTVHSESAPAMALWFRVEDVFSVDIRANNRGVFISATTTCIWPSGHRPLS
jgi:hypothetical protein